MGEIGRRAPRIGSLDGLTTGKRIQALRLERGLSPAALAAAAQMSSQAISKLESDGSNEPSYLNGLRIANALGVSPWYLAGEEDPVTAPVTFLPSTATRPDFGAAERLPDPDLVQISRDLALLTKTVQAQQLEMEELRRLAAPSGGRARKRAV